MVRKIILVGVMFVTSIWIGTTLIPEHVIAQTQASPPMELNVPKILQPPQETQSIDIAIDLTTKDVTINGTQNAKVNVRMFNEPEPVVRTVVKYKDRVVNQGYPHTKVMDNYIKSITGEPILNLDGK